MSKIQKLIANIGSIFYFMIKFRFKYLIYLKEYRFIKKTQYKSINYNLSIQKTRLYNLINFAIKNVPYYRELAKKRNIKITYDTIFKDIEQFPILTKELIRKNWNLLHPKLKRKNFIIITSGGTTGEPIKILHDNEFIIKSSAAMDIFFEIGNLLKGDKLIRLWGDERQIFNKKTDYFKYLKNRYLKNTHFLNAFRMNDKIMRRYVYEINLIKPKVIYSYIQSIYEVAKYIKSHNLSLTPIKSIITTAGVSTGYFRKFIGQIFNCFVYNLYGSREVSITAINCEKSSKLHINMLQKYIEIVDNYEKRLREHEKGNIIITPLFNYAMPLIRYKIGDRGSLDYSQCSCGRGLIRLDNIYGRTVDIFKTINNGLIDGEYFTHLFYPLDNVKKFQIIQENYNKILINLVTLDSNPLKKSIEIDLTKKIRKVMGDDCQIYFNYLEDIKPENSGKLRYTISKV